MSDDGVALKLNTRRRRPTTAKELAAARAGLYAAIRPMLVELPDADVWIDRAVTEGADRARLTSIVRAKVDDLLGTALDAGRLDLIERCLPLLQALQGRGRPADREHPTLRACEAHLSRDRARLRRRVAAAGFGAGRGGARVPAPSPDTVVGGGHLDRLPAVTDHALRIYDYLRGVLPVARRRQGRDRPVQYHQRALVLAAELTRAIYWPLIQRGLTPTTLKARIQTRTRRPAR